MPPANLPSQSAAGLNKAQEHADPQVPSEVPPVETGQPDAFDFVDIPDEGNAPDEVPVADVASLADLPDSIPNADLPPEVPADALDGLFDHLPDFLL